MAVVVAGPHRSRDLVFRRSDVDSSASVRNPL